jgi:DDE superfamily endonuclease
VVDQATQTIICAAHGKGSGHDFKLFKTSQVRLQPHTIALTDTGYLGLQHLHAKTTMPKKRSKNKPLSKDNEQNNRQLAQQRVRVENVIACIKRFKIISDKYRNRRKRFGLRFSLIAALYNHSLTP